MPRSNAFSSTMTYQKEVLVTLNGHTFSVTENLYTALLYLQNRQLERTIRIDALCINQYDAAEKSKQIPLIRTIYAKAAHVVVWLGEGTEDGGKALEGIRFLAGKDTYSKAVCETHRYACLKLLQREWFRRVWVLQEVGVAQSIYIMCGYVQLSGHIFCEGLNKLELPLNLLKKVGPVICLIKDAPFRPKFETNSRGAFSLGRLIGMYRDYRASQPHDKIYALLGLSADVDSADLQPNYGIAWHQLLKVATSHIFPKSSIQTWEGTESAVIKSKGWILGHIHSVAQDITGFGQRITLLLNDTAESLGYREIWQSEWVVETCAELIKDGDIVCLLQGRSEPSIIRLCNDHFTVITPSVQPQQRNQTEGLKPALQIRRDIPGLHDILLTLRLRLVEGGLESNIPLGLMDMAPEYRETHTESELRLNHIALVVVGIAAKARNQNPKSRGLENILGQSGTCNPVIEVLKVAAANPGSYGDRIIQILLHQRHESLAVSEGVVKAAAGDPEDCGHETLRLLFQQRGESLPVSEEVVMAAAGNPGDCGHKTLRLLFQQRGESLPVSEDVVKAAAGNTGYYGPRIMEVLFQHRGEDLPVSEDVVKAAAENTGFHELEITEVLFRHWKESLPVLPVAEKPRHCSG
ncbi:HET domain-containing protein [Aspergillus thermomutatus]|uniref:Heterokaryon incompatibility domain-containing protein n=1 Tax=Aspergillus thermomutatus TaxID=41047 RepID=A0A397GB64_ASPTH|nr:uncharacterized protein CDV56_101705 [Aspergillus thermomutatus]RHZ45340.1 hypothetical protein CDV56_101705 [Aspergillus thermomutatus]